MKDSEIFFATQPHAMSKDDFVACFGGVYEHTPTIAERTWQQRLDTSHNSVDGLANALASTVDAFKQEELLQLINAHPDLAGRAAVAGELTAESTSEQASAGIGQCSAAEYAQFREYNERYKTRFGFTFIMAVKGSNRFEILKSFEERIDNDRDTELKRARSEIHKIARIRLHEIATGAEAKPMSSNDNTDHPFTDWTDLAQPRLGTEVVFATDDFFADKSRLISPADPVFIADKFDDNGKWMDGWESRRKRTPGYDYCIVRLGVAGAIKGVDIDTSHFTGNFPPAASIDACVSSEAIPDDDAVWSEIVANTELDGDSHNFRPVADEREFTHLRLNIYPDGGVARLRVYGEIQPNWGGRAADERVDLLALESGGKALLCNDEHFGSMRNLNAPGRGVNMGDGWETARRRGPGNDWVILALGHPGYIREIVVDTAHFKGNYPNEVSIRGALVSSADKHTIESVSTDWAVLLPRAKLSMDNEHHFAAELQDIGPISHLRMDIFPDGGISRLRMFGNLFREDEAT